jgi:hypothetical protein
VFNFLKNKEVRNIIKTNKKALEKETGKFKRNKYKKAKQIGKIFSV